jgi:hypothetical protein
VARLARLNGQWLGEYVVFVKEWAQNVTRKLLGANTGRRHHQVDHGRAGDAHLQITAHRASETRAFSHRGDFSGLADAAIVAHIYRQHIGGSCAHRAMASCNVLTLSSAMIGTCTWLRTSAIHAASRAGTGCSTK